MYSDHGSKQGEQGYRLVTPVKHWSEDDELACPGLDASRLLVHTRQLNVVVVGS